MTHGSEFIYDDCGSFVDISSTAPVDLCWTRLKRWPPTWLLQTVEDRSPVMLVRENSYFRPRRYPTRIDCHKIRGIITSGWIGEKPSVVGLVFHLVVRFLGVPFPYRPCDTLQTSDGLVAVYTQRDAIDGSWRRWPVEIAVQNNVYRLSREHFPAEKRSLFNGHKLVVSDENGEAATAVVDRTNPKLGRITLHHNIQGIEAVLAFLFLEARELEIDS